MRLSATVLHTAKATHRAAYDLQHEYAASGERMTSAWVRVVVCVLPCACCARCAANRAMACTGSRTAATLPTHDGGLMYHSHAVITSRACCVLKLRASLLCRVPVHSFAPSGVCDLGRLVVPRTAMNCIDSHTHGACGVRFFPFFGTTDNPCSRVRCARRSCCSMIRTARRRVLSSKSNVEIYITPCSFDRLYILPRDVLHPVTSSTEATTAPRR